MKGQIQQKFQLQQFDKNQKNLQYQIDQHIYSRINYKQHQKSSIKLLTFVIILAIGLCLKFLVKERGYYNYNQFDPKKSADEQPLLSDQDQKFDNKIYQQLAAKLPQTKRFVYLKYQDHNELAKQEYDYFEKKYNISQYPQLPFCLVITSYNNMGNNRYKKNLDSLILQNYSNYRAIIYEDVSTDGTGQAIDKYLEEHPKFKNKIKVIHNKIRTTSMYNLRRGAMDFCKPEQIYMLYDGDDELIGRQVLKVFNAFYHKTKAWFVYSTTMMSIGQVGHSKPYFNRTIEENSYRKFYDFRTQHLKSYYNQLFRLVEDDDLRDYDGDYYKFTSDQAICLPMIQMAHRKVAFIPQMLYLYNMNTGLNDATTNHLEQRLVQIRIRQKQPYKQLSELIIPKQFDSQAVQQFRRRNSQLLLGEKS